MCANALDIEPGLRSCADNYAECLPRRNPARPALCMKKRPCAEKGMPHPGRLQQGKQCLSNLFMQRHRAGFLFALHVAFRNVDNFGDFAAVVDVTNPEGQDFVDTEASVDPHQDQSDVAGTVAALAGIKKSGNLIFGQGAAAGVVHKKRYFRHETGKIPRTELRGECEISAFTESGGNLAALFSQNRDRGNHTANFLRAAITLFRRWGWNHQGGTDYLLLRQVVSGKLTTPEASLILAKSAPSQIPFIAG